MGSNKINCNFCIAPNFAFGLCEAEVSHQLGWKCTVRLILRKVCVVNYPQDTSAMPVQQQALGPLPKSAPQPTHDLGNGSSSPFSSCPSSQFHEPSSCSPTILCGQTASLSTPTLRQKSRHKPTWVYRTNFCHTFLLERICRDFPLVLPELFVTMPCRLNHCSQQVPSKVRTLYH